MCALSQQGTQSGQKATLQEESQENKCPNLILLTPSICYWRPLIGQTHLEVQVQQCLLIQSMYSIQLPRAVMHVHAKSLQSCPTLCNPMDYSLQGPSVHGILQERILKWVAISFFRGFSGPRDRISISYISCPGRWVLYHEHHLGSRATGRVKKGREWI